MLVRARGLGRSVRGGMCWGSKGNLRLAQTEGACESPSEIGREKSWRQTREAKGRRKEGRERETCYTLHSRNSEAESETKPGLDFLSTLGRGSARVGVKVPVF